MGQQENALPDLQRYTAFDEELRELPTDRLVFTQAIREAQKQLKQAMQDSDDVVIIRLLGYLGDACRVAGRLTEAVEYLDEAVRRAQQCGISRAEYPNRIRLAEVHKYRGEWAVAEGMLQQVAKTLQDDPQSDLYHFALQHWGKCLLDQQKWDEAIAILEETLAIRNQRGNRSWIHSTEIALKRAKARGGDISDPRSVGK
jgi:tetratricopeptide (TPR) repeat protein